MREQENKKTNKINKIATIMILSAMLMSLGACNKSADQMKNDVTNEATEMKDDVTQKAGELTDDVVDPDGNYRSDSDGMVDPDLNGHQSLGEQAKDMMAESDVLQTMAGIELNEEELNSLDKKKQGWGQGNNKNEKNQPIDAVKFQEKYSKYNAFFIRDLGEKKIYLTFDEGYENGYTGKILDVLKEKKVPAVFFVTMSYAKNNPDLINRMINEGHIVGNHSVNHKSFPDLTIDEAREEVEGLHSYIKENFNYDMKLFRFPAGEFSERDLELLNKLGYKSIFWSFAYADWDPNQQMESSKAKEKVLSSVHDGEILFLHCVSETNSKILGDVLDEIRAKGYSINKFM